MREFSRLSLGKLGAAAFLGGVLSACVAALIERVAPNVFGRWIPVVTGFIAGVLSVLIISVVERSD